MVVAIKRRTFKRLKLLFVCVLLILVCVKIHPVTYVMQKIYPLKYEDIIIKYSREYNLDRCLVMAVISAESNFDETAQSHKNAKGLMQVTDDTAQWICKKYGINANGAENDKNDKNTEKIKNFDFFDPDTNIHIGCAYLEFLLDTFDGNVKNSIAAYNAGHGNVAKWLDDSNHTDDGENLKSIPFGETDKYVNKVIKRIYIYKKLYGGK